MAARTAALLAAILVATGALAGCTSRDPAPTPDDPGTPAPVTPAPGNSGSGSTPPRPQEPQRPADFTLADSGSIQGPFEKSWDVIVANVAFGKAEIAFALTPIQAGAPPTAHVTLELLSPTGEPIKVDTVGLGAQADNLRWTFTPGQLPEAGTYRLLATSSDPAPLPSAGFADYQLEVTIEY